MNYLKNSHLKLVKNSYLKTFPHKDFLKKIFYKLLESQKCIFLN